MEEICPSQPSLDTILSAKKWNNTTCSAAKNRNEVSAGKRGRVASKFIMLEDTLRVRRMFRCTRPSTIYWWKLLLQARKGIASPPERGVLLRASLLGYLDRAGGRHPSPEAVRNNFSFSDGS